MKDLPPLGRREQVLVAGVLVLASVLLLRPSIRGRDGCGNYVYLMSLLTDGDLDFSDDYAALEQTPESRVKQTEAPRHPETGLPSNRFGIGSALLWAPFVLPVHLGLLLVDAPSANGLSRPYARAVGVGSAFWGCLGLSLLYRRLRRQFSPLASALAVGGMTFATPLGFYLWAHGSMSHATSFMLAVAGLLLLERAWEAPTPTRLLGLGAAAGGLFITRFQDVTWSAALLGGLLLGPSTPAALRSRLHHVALFSAGAALVLLPQLVVWKVLYGSFFSGPVPYLKSSNFLPMPLNLGRILFGGHRGALLWHPILLVAAVGTLVGRPPSPALWRTGVVGLVLQLYLLGSFAIYWAGASFGNRFFISSYPLLTFGLAWAWERLRAPRLALALTGLLVAWNAGLLVQYATEMMPREAPVQWSQVVRNQVTAVPALLLRGLLRGVGERLGR